MDHDVEHYVHVEAAGREGPEPMHFHKARVPDFAQQHLRRGIEALNVSDLQNRPVLRSQRNQLVGFCQGRRHGLFDQDVPAEGQGQLGRAAVIHGRHSDGHGIALGDERLCLRKCLRRVTRRDLTGARSVCVANADQPCTGQLGIDARMVLAERADSYDADSDGVHAHSGGSRPQMAMPSSSARASTASRSIISVRPESMANTRAPASSIAAKVPRPTTGTSKRRS